MGEGFFWEVGTTAIFGFFGNDIIGGLAQMVERIVSIDEVVGSIPIFSKKKIYLPINPTLAQG